MPQAISVISAVATVAGTVGSYAASRKASKASKEQNALVDRRNRMSAIREAQIKRAQALSFAAASGGLGSSAQQGGISSLGSQLGSGLGFSSQMTGLSNQISSANQSANAYGALAGIGSTVFKRYGDWDSFKGFLSPQPTTTTYNGSPRPAPNPYYQ